MSDCNQQDPSARVSTMRWNDQSPSGMPFALGFFLTAHAIDWPLEGRMMVGRTGSGAHIEIPAMAISSRHGEFGVEQGRVFYRDLGSTNGSWLDGERVEGTVELHEGSRLELARDRRGEATFTIVLAYGSPQGFTWQKVPFDASVQEVVLGRAYGNVRLTDPFASERHASFFNSEKGPHVLDLQSTNGVWVGTSRVAGSAPIEPGDVVRIGSTWVFVQKDELCIGAYGLTLDGIGHASAPDPWAAEAERQASQTAQLTDIPVARKDDHPDGSGQSSAATSNAPRQSGLTIDIEEKNVWHRLKKKTLLRDVRLSIDPGDFVLILGGSGAGKTTFFNAVMGSSKAEGSVKLGDLDIYEEYERIKYQIGYVPQLNDLRLADSVRDTLISAARLRMPASSTRLECQEQAIKAAELLGLKRELGTMVGNLSGGQRKRVSIAVQLVGDPSLFFLDEPDSGLDGIMSRALMENLSSIANLGKMVLLITHGPDRGADLFTKVIVLAKSERDGAGHLVCCGTVEETKSFFGVDSLEGVVRRINRPDEGGDGKADYYLDKWEAAHHG